MSVSCQSHLPQLAQELKESLIQTVCVSWVFFLKSLVLNVIDGANHFAPNCWCFTLGSHFLFSCRQRNTCGLVEFGEIRHRSESKQRCPPIPLASAQQHFSGAKDWQTPARLLGTSRYRGPNGGLPAQPGTTVPAGLKPSTLQVQDPPIAFAEPTGRVRQGACESDRIVRVCRFRPGEAASLRSRSER